ncbi:cysteine-rich RLK (RECEPTOR-like protein kinase) 8, partial [Striga hermonthica]
SFIMSFNPLSVILKENQLTGPNYIDWKRNLDIVLTAESYKYVLTEACPDVPADNALDEEKQEYARWKKADEMAKRYILASMSNCVADSTMEAEYIAASEAVKEAVWLRNFLVDLEVILSSPRVITVYCDNSGAVANSREPRAHRASKNIERKYHLIRYIVARGEVEITKIASEDNLADPFTKSLPEKVFAKHVEGIGVKSSDHTTTTRTTRRRDRHRYHRHPPPHAPPEGSSCQILLARVRARGSLVFQSVNAVDFAVTPAFRIGQVCSIPRSYELRSAIKDQRTKIPAIKIKYTNYEIIQDSAVYRILITTEAIPTPKIPIFLEHASTHKISIALKFHSIPTSIQFLKIRTPKQRAYEVINSSTTQQDSNLFRDLHLRPRTRCSNSYSNLTRVYMISFENERGSTGPRARRLHTSRRKERTTLAEWGSNGTSNCSPTGLDAGQGLRGDRLRWFTMALSRKRRARVAACCCVAEEGSRGYAAGVGVTPRLS